MQVLTEMRNSLQLPPTLVSLVGEEWYKVWSKTMHLKKKNVARSY